MTSMSSGAPASSVENADEGCRPAGTSRVGAEDVDGEFGHDLVVLAPVQLGDRSVGARMMALQELGQHAHAVVPHDLHLAVGPRQLLADDRVIGDATLLGEHEQPVDLGLETDRARGGRLTPLEAEQCHGDAPTVVDAADDVLLRARGVGVEDLVELAVAGDHLDRAHLDTRLAHVDEQERDALCASGRRDRCGRA